MACLTPKTKEESLQGLLAALDNVEGAGEIMQQEGFRNLITEIHDGAWMNGFAAGATTGMDALTKKLLDI